MILLSLTGVFGIESFGGNISRDLHILLEKRMDLIEFSFCISFSWFFPLFSGCCALP